MHYLRLNRIGAVLAAAAVVGVALPVTASTVIFEENFSVRGTHSGVFGSPPNITNTGAATYVRGPQLAEATAGTIGHYGDPSLNIKGLLFQPLDPENTPPEEQKAGTHTQNMALPYSYNFGDNPIRLTLTVRKATQEWNQFVFGFTDSNQNISNMLMLQRNPSGMNPNRTRLDLYHNGLIYRINYPPGIDAEFFRDLVLEYDPTKVNTPGVHPYTFTVDGMPIALSQTPQGVSEDVGLPPMDLFGPNDIGGIGWGFWFADGNLDRSALIQSMKFEILDAAAPCQPGDFNCDGVVDAADYVEWRKGAALPAEYTLWRENFGAGSSGAGTGFATAVPEAATGTLLVIGWLAGGLWRGITGRRRGQQ